MESSGSVFFFPLFSFSSVLHWRGKKKAGCVYLSASIHTVTCKETTSAITADTSSADPRQHILTPATCLHGYTHTHVHTHLGTLIDFLELSRL